MPQKGKRIDFLKKELATDMDGYTVHYQLHPRDMTARPSRLAKLKGLRIRRPRNK